jgi:hypothetical protein
MKRILFLLFVLFTFNGFSQDCKDIEYKKDDFTGNETFTSPFVLKNKIFPVSLVKFIKNNDTLFFLNLRAYGSTVNLNKKSIIILFTDGSKLELTETIDCKVSKDVETDKNYTYSTTILISDEQLLILRKKLISKYRLYIYDLELTEKQSSYFNAYINCM